MKRNNPFIPTIKKNFSSLTETTSQTTSIEIPSFPNFYVTENITETFPSETSFIRRHILGETRRKGFSNLTMDEGLPNGGRHGSTTRAQFAEMFFGMLDDIKKREAIRKNAPQTKVVQEIVPHENVEQNIKNNIHLIISNVNREELDGLHLTLARLVYLKAFIIEFTAKILKWNKIFSEIQRRNGDNNKEYIDREYKSEFNALIKKLKGKIEINLINEINNSINEKISKIKKYLIEEIDQKLIKMEGRKEYKESIKYYNSLKSAYQKTASSGLLLTEPMISFLESKQEEEIRKILSVGRIRLGSNFSEDGENETNTNNPPQKINWEEYDDQSIIVEEFEDDFFLQNDFFTSGLMLVNLITSGGVLEKSAICILVCLFYTFTLESELSDIYDIKYGSDGSIEKFEEYDNHVVTRGLRRLRINKKADDVIENLAKE